MDVADNHAGEVAVPGVVGQGWTFTPRLPGGVFPTGGAVRAGQNRVEVGP